MKTTTQPTTAVRPWYANLGGSTNDTLHLQSVKTGADGYANTPITSLAELRAEAERVGATKVLFGASWMPRRSVALDNVSEAMMRKLLRVSSASTKRQASGR